MDDNKASQRRRGGGKVTEKRGHGSDTTVPSHRVRPPHGSGATGHPGSQRSQSPGEDEQEE